MVEARIRQYISAGQPAYSTPQAWQVIPNGQPYTIGFSTDPAAIAAGGATLLEYRTTKLGAGAFPALTEVAFTATAVTVSEYEPRDVLVTICDEKDNYRFAFTKQEKDNEIAGIGNHYEFKYRGYDTRLGRFMSVDPLHRDYPWNSTYAYAENRVIDGFDLEGLEWAGYMGAHPWSMMAHNFAKSFDAFLNSIKVSFNSVNSKIRELGSKLTRNTSVSVSVKNSNTTVVEYQGWDLFKPSAWTKNSDGTYSNMPLPKIKVSNENTVQTNTELVVKKANSKFSKTVSRSPDGNQTTTTTLESTVMSNSRVPVTGSVSRTSSTDGTSSNSGKVSVGYDWLNGFAEVKSSSDGQTNTSIGVQSTISTPSVGGARYESENTLKATITQ